MKVEEKYENTLKAISKADIEDVMNLPNLKLEKIEISEDCVYEFKSISDSEKSGYKYAIEFHKDDSLY